MVDTSLHPNHYKCKSIMVTTINHCNSREIFQGLKEHTSRKVRISINWLVKMVIPGRKHFCFISWISLVYLSQETWEHIRDREENNRTYSWSKILANEVLMSPHPPGYFGSSFPPSAPSQNKTIQNKWRIPYSCATQRESRYS